eukprot:CAMPEP_0119259096 /NCGR_PEP_ID=MMETSP1329-20130426/50_1 /TAXON_ID=114041 /ORGANISM="Genus nov. species nov., Strain RCC1024" /LENGTH=101 /DNA_ID=CAMNT_0007258455 /DNA_START=182 /DNA_END=487 /DNA_ORIENTATION=-
MSDLNSLLAGATAVMGSKDAAAKSAHATKVFRALAQIDDKRIDATVEALAPDAADVLLKYVYRGLEEPTDNNASLFKWQAKISDKFGVGSVVRVLTDRKTV